MTIRRVQAAAAFGLALATFVFPAGAAKAESVSPQAIDIGSRPGQPGDRYRFVAGSVADITGAQTIHQTLDVIFEVEVVAVEEDKAVVRYTIREIAIQDERSHIGGWARAWRGVTIEFEATPLYQPRRILNWPETRAAFFAAVSGDPAVTPADRQSMEAYIRMLERQGHDAIVAELLPAISMLSQLRVPGMVVGRQAVAQDPVPEGAKGPVGETWLEAGAPDPVTCEVPVALTRRPAGPGAAPASSLNLLDVKGTLSTRDGWAVTLSHRELQVDARQTRLEITTIAREGAAPGCGAG